MGKPWGLLDGAVCLTVVYNTEVYRVPWVLSWLYRNRPECGSYFGCYKVHHFHCK
jgi:hypothetical protein